jgi:hypothetical protein
MAGEKFSDGKDYPPLPVDTKKQMAFVALAANRQ